MSNTLTSAKSTLKDRKFWTGLALGAIMTGTVAMVKPINAAAPAATGGATESTQKLIGGALAQMMKSQQAMQADLTSIKNSATSMDSSLKSLKEASTFNQPQPR